MINSTDTTETIPIVQVVGNDHSPTPELDALSVKPQKRYVFIRSIGFGGMKAVLLVHDAETDRDVAMALMPDFRERPRQDLESFVHEAKLTAKLEHPNIVPVYDIGIDSSGSPYFVMKYLRGMPLDALLRRIASGDVEATKYTLDRLLMIYLRVCNAVDFAHSRQICHLDLKPGNVNIGDFGEVYVLDWGLAQLMDKTGQVPPFSHTRGTPGFVAPECFNHNAPVGRRADIFALGGLLYSILALQTPLAGLASPEVFRRTGRGEIPPPSAVAPESWHVPAALEAVAMKALSPDPAKRYATVAEIKAEIRAFNSGYASRAENATRLRKLGLFFRRNRLWVAIVLLTAGLIYFAIQYYLLARGQ